MSAAFTRPALLEPAVEPLPATLGRYRLGRKLATGGMATVYLAVPEDSAYVVRPLALKRIHPHLASEKAFVDMFIDEARIASRLQHPNLCGVLDFGEADGSYFMTMEYLVGEPLSRLNAALLRRTEPGSPARLARVAAQILCDACEGLHSAHELRDDNGVALNVVHRDVTPSNIFITYEGPTRVVDFGIASAADCVHHTSTGTIRGKFGYMSPDHFNGERPDRRADIWALGVVLWETIAQRPLFRRDNPSLTMMATLESHVPALHEIVPGLDPALTRIAARALAKKREDRYQTAAQMAVDLQQFLASSGAPSARAEIASLVTELFPAGEGEKRRLIKAVVEGRRSIPPRESEPGAAEARISDSQVVPKGWRSRTPRALRAQSVWAPLTAGLSIAIATCSVIWALRERPAHAPPPPPPPPMVMVRNEVAPPRAPTPASSPPALLPSKTMPQERSAATPAPPASERPRSREVASAEGNPPSEKHENSPRTASASPETLSAPLPFTSAPVLREPKAPVAARTEEPKPSSAAPAAQAAKSEPASRRAAAAPRTVPSAWRHARRRDAAEALASDDELGTGLVSVTTSGDWAEVYHEGHLLGPTPGRFSLPEGRQVLLLRPGGGGTPRSVIVVVRADETVRVRADL